MNRAVVHLLRHGEVYNPDKVLYGRLPGFRLSDLGQAQAKLAAEYLSRFDVGQIYSSPLERALQTAAPLASALGLEVNKEERLIEAANYLEGKRVAGGENLRQLFAEPKNWKYLVNPLRPSWGEPYKVVAARVLSGLRDAAEKSGGRETVCVSHQLPIVAARRSAQGLRLAHDPRKRQCSLASVTSFTFIDGLVVKVEYNEPAATLPAGFGAGA
jgi:broad specificity phosphatase PhoE